MSNTHRAFFGALSVLILVGILFSTSAAIILWLPVFGLGFAAITGNCPGLSIAGKALDKLGIER